MSADPDDHLSRISTLWTQVFRAHDHSPEAAKVAQSAVIERYSGAVYRYLRCVLRDADAADEVFQEFALNFVRGGFRHADPEKGRFRDYVKISILRLVSQYRKRNWRRGQALDAQQLAATDGPEADQNSDETFLKSCREEFLGRAWTLLAAVESRTGQPLHTVLDYRARHPEATSDEMAAELTSHLAPERPLTAAGVRKTLQRARTKFADLLIDEVSQSLVEPSREELEREIIDLGLHSYCQRAIARRFGPPPSA